MTSRVVKRQRLSMRGGTGVFTSSPVIVVENICIANLIG